MMLSLFIEYIMKSSFRPFIFDQLLYVLHVSKCDQSLPLIFT